MRTTEVITAASIETVDSELIIRLADREVRIPWERCSPILATAAPEQRRRAELSPGGYGIHWPLFDEDIFIGGLAAWNAAITGHQHHYSVLHAGRTESRTAWPTRLE